LDTTAILAFLAIACRNRRLFGALLRSRQTKMAAPGQNSWKRFMPILKAVS